MRLKGMSFIQYKYNKNFTKEKKTLNSCQKFKQCFSNLW